MKETEVTQTEMEEFADARRQIEIAAGLMGAAVDEPFLSVTRRICKLAFDLPVSGPDLKTRSENKRLHIEVSEAQARAIESHAWKDVSATDYQRICESVADLKAQFGGTLDPPPAPAPVESIQCTREALIVAKIQIEAARSLMRAVVGESLLPATRRVCRLAFYRESKPISKIRAENNDLRSELRRYHAELQLVVVGVPVWQYQYAERELQLYYRKKQFAESFKVTENVSTS